MCIRDRDETATVSAADFSATNSAIRLAGTYTVYVRDNTGAAGFCEYQENITLDAIELPTVVSTPTQPLCAGELGSFSLEGSLGTPPYTISVAVPTGSTAIADRTGVTTLPESYIDLDEGLYTITITDSNGCTGTTTETITAPTALSGGSAVATDYLCDTDGVTPILGTITFTAPAGGSGSYVYSYKLSTETDFITTTNTSVSGLLFGTYNVQVSDTSGCPLVLPCLLYTSPSPRD